MKSKVEKQLRENMRENFGNTGAGKNFLTKNFLINLKNIVRVKQIAEKALHLYIYIQFKKSVYICVIRDTNLCDKNLNFGQKGYISTLE